MAGRAMKVKSRRSKTSSRKPYVRKRSFSEKLHEMGLKAIVALSFGLYLLFLFLLSVSIPENPFVVGLGFLPVLLYLVTIFTLLFRGKEMVELLYLLPLLFGVLFYVVWSLDVIPELAAMDGGMLTVLNLVVSYVYAMILSFVHPVTSSRKAVDSNSVIYTNTEDVSSELAAVELDDEKVSVTIRAIEDKCKAINFVVGRVYSDKKGGSKDIRSKIVIPRELYNAFSELTDEEGTYDKLKLLSVVENIYARLKRLTHPEKELFVIGEGKLPVERDSSGNDSVLNVLTKNDKDPVEDYYKAALGVCEQVVEYLRRNS